MTLDTDSTLAGLVLFLFYSILITVTQPRTTTSSSYLSIFLFHSTLATHWHRHRDHQPRLPRTRLRTFTLLPILACAKGVLKTIFKPTSKSNVFSTRFVEWRYVEGWVALALALHSIGEVDRGKRQPYSPILVLVLVILLQRLLTQLNGFDYCS